MPVKTKSPAPAWSYSKLTCYEQCPRQFYYRHVVKLPEEKSPAMERGSAIHSALEMFVKSKKPPRLDRELMKNVRVNLSAFKKKGAVAERELAFDDAWRQVDWFSKDARVRAKIDLSVPLAKDRSNNLDYKTGRPNPERHVEQMQFYGVLILVVDRHINHAEHGLWYVDHHDKPFQTGIIERNAAELKRSLDMWRGRAARIYADRKWKARPSPSACRWCPFSVKKGGPCQDGV